MLGRMASKRGRPAVEKPKARQVGFRVDVELGKLFDAAVAQAATEAPIGSNFTQSDYLRGLFLKDAERRGLTKTAPRKRGQKGGG